MRHCKRATAAGAMRGEHTTAKEKTSTLSVTRSVSSCSRRSGLSDCNVTDARAVSPLQLEVLACRLACLLVLAVLELHLLTSCIHLHTLVDAYSGSSQH